MNKIGRNTVDENQLQIICVISYILHCVGFWWIAVIIDYMKLPDSKGTIFESHFRWQIDTFWRYILLYILGFLTLAIGIGAIILIITTILYWYRMIKGILRLMDNKIIN